MAKYIVTYGHARIEDIENKVLKIVDSKKELYRFLKNYLRKNIDKDISDENWGIKLYTSSDDDSHDAKL